MSKACSNPQPPNLGGLVNIPNAITCCNLISGCLAILAALLLDAKIALSLIILGAVFDFFDGMTARLLHVSSPIGKELDSLADVVTFGVAPATIVYAALRVIDYPSFLEPVRDIIPFFAFIMAAFSALRLAKFNLDERQAMGFIGLPTPANALFWGALIVGTHPYFGYPNYAARLTWCILIGIAVSCWLLVSEVPMFALKFKTWGWKGNELRYIFIITSALLMIGFAALGFGVLGISAVIAWYLILSIVRKT